MRCSGSRTTARSQPAQGAAVDRKRWEERFAAVRGDLDGARAKLAKAQADLEALAHKSDSWQMAAPGAQPNAENSPVSYKLRQEIRQYREDVGRAERRLRELEVEASLAGVPADGVSPCTPTRRRRRARRSPNKAPRRSPRASTIAPRPEDGGPQRPRVIRAWRARSAQLAPMSELPPMKSHDLDAMFRVIPRCPGGARAAQ